MRNLYIILIIVISQSLLFAGKSTKVNKKNNKAKIIKKIKMIKHLDLDETQSEKLFTREKDLNKQIDAINKKKNAIKIKMNSIKNKSNVTHSEVDDLIDEMDDLDMERKKLRRVHQKGVNDILTPSQRLKYVNFDDHFKKEMKEKIKKGKKPRKKRGPR